MLSIWDLNAFITNLCKALCQNHFLVFVVDYDFFFGGYFSYLFWLGTSFFQSVYCFFPFCFVHDYSEAPSHVESSEHFLIGNRVAQFQSGFLYQPEDVLRLEVVEFEAYVRREPSEIVEFQVSVTSYVDGCFYLHGSGCFEERFHVDFGGLQNFKGYFPA